MPSIQTHGQRPVEVIHPLANRDLELEDADAPVLVADVSNLRAISVLGSPSAAYKIIFALTTTLCGSV